MQKKVLALLAAVLLLGALAGCGSSSASGSAASTPSASTNSPSITIPEDLTSETRAFLTDEGEDYSEYIIVYAGKDTGALTALADRVYFSKSAGYTVEIVQVFNPDSFITDFSSLSFASFTVEEKSTLDLGDCIVAEFKFDDLKNNDNLIALEDRDVLVLEDRNADSISAESICDSLIKSGAQEIDRSKFVGLGLPIM